MSWDFSSLRKLAETQTHWLVESEGDCLSISSDDGLDAFVYIGENQITVESTLFPLSSVENVGAVNDMFLRTHHLVPLTSVAIKTIGGKDYYVAFGSLSVDSKESVFIEEVNSLFANLTEFIDLCSDHLKETV